MKGLKALVRRNLTELSRRVPRIGRQQLSRIRRGDTTIQRQVSQKVLAMRSASKLPGLVVPGKGDVVVGGPVRPRRAKVVGAFDAHQHMIHLRQLVEDALQAAGVQVYRLPGQTPPVLVIRDSDRHRAWQALSSSLSDAWAEEKRGRPRQVSSAGDRWAPEVSKIFQFLAAPSGAEVANGQQYVQLEAWTEIADENVVRPDGGFHEVGTLLRRGAYNTFASYLTPSVQETLLPWGPRFRDYLPPVSAVTEPVDLVYTWVDGHDPAWAEKRARWGGEGYASDAQISSRFDNRDELRYSLRSVEMYANWFGTLFLVTDGQVPDWLNLDHPRLVRVDHRELFDDSELPVFNSHSIESRLHRIAGLSENFIYLNDDVFFGRPVYPELFFTGGGHLKYFPSRAHIDPAPRTLDDVSVSSAAKNNRALLEASVGRTVTRKLKHTPHAHLRSVLAEMESRYPEVFAANVAARFRSHDDHAVVSGLAQRYAAATGRAVEGDIVYNYADISRPDVRSHLAKWLREHAYDVFCLNDTGVRALGKDNEDAVLSFLETYFPLASRFEV